MNRGARGARKPSPSLIVGALVSIAVLAGLIDVIVSAVGDSTDSPPPTGRACEKLLEQQSPDLMARAAQLLRDQSGLSAIADCDSGD